MDKLVFYLTALWIRLNSKRWYSSRVQAYETLNRAYGYLYEDYITRASTKSRNALLPEHREALKILSYFESEAYETSLKFSTLKNCYEFVKEEICTTGFSIG